ncbi:MAG: hypothetical protein Q8P73_00260 [bacterium]|nr:hypothetical protein [bacterium]
MGKTKTPDKCEALGKTLAALAKGCGLEIVVRAAQPSEQLPEHRENTTEEREAIRQHKIDDLFWLGDKIANDDAFRGRVEGQYVAVYDRRLICSATSAKPASQRAAKVLKVPEGAILIVPIKVRDPDADEAYQNLQHELGIA